ncbi:MAG: glucosaminidase domain-containing protein [Cellvibrionaceae bacterium]
MSSNSHTSTIYPSGKSTFLLAIFTLYTFACVALVGFLSNHPLIPSSQLESQKDKAHLLKETSFNNSNIKTKNIKPDFKKIKKVKEKKTAFFQYLLPMINHINENTTIRRKNLLQIQAEYLSNNSQAESIENLQHPLLSKNSLKYLDSLSKTYRINIEKNSTEQKINKLLLRVDKIPPSMILAQAANESAWGTSRFATKANNYFGQWCFRKGCGIIPKLRAEDKYHEVAKFKSVYHSVESYFNNINTHRAYRSLRNHRASLRKEQRKITGLEMITHLSSYSSRGEEYVKELRRMIKMNKLLQHDVKKEVSDKLQEIDDPSGKKSPQEN